MPREMSSVPASVLTLTVNAYSPSRYVEYIAYATHTHRAAVCKIRQLQPTIHNTKSFRPPKCSKHLCDL